jgi:membrane-associated phospholipid phosphatase
MIFRDRIGRWAATIACALVAAISTANRVQAQEAVISGRDIALTAAATAGAVALSRADARIARAFSDSGFHARHPGFRTAANRASIATETVFMSTGAVVWGIGRMRNDGGTADVGLHVAESVASAAMFIQIVRGALGRARPYVLGDDGKKRDAHPYEFDALHGFTSFNYRSFPSMHAMASFAVATALTEEMRVRHAPHRQVVAPALYAAAVMPSLARMYLDEHWASDIAMGMFLGVLAGQKVVLYSHAHPGNAIDRRFLRPTVHAGLRVGAEGLSLTLVPF